MSRLLRKTEAVKIFEIILRLFTVISIKNQTSQRIELIMPHNDKPIGFLMTQKKK